MANATSTQLQELYVAYFGRAADPTGLDYWTEQGITQAAFAADMYAQNEFSSAYGSKTVEAQVNQIYKNLFDREADVAGLTYWTQEINLGNLQVAEIATHLIWAAQNNSGSAADKTALSNRTAAAIAYTAEVKKTTAGILAYQPQSTDPWVSGENITEAVTYLSGIDGTTEYTAAGITSSVATLTGNGDPTGVGSTFVLTTNTDSAGKTSAANGTISSTFRFTDGGNEVISADIGTIQSADVLLDGSSTDSDVMNITANAVLGTFTANRIEKFVVDMAAGTPDFDVTNITNFNTIEVKGNVAGDIIELNAQSKQPTIKTTDYTRVLTVNVEQLSGTTTASTAETVNLEVSGSSYGSAAATRSGITLTGDDGTGTLETLNITSSGSAANDFALDVTNANVTLETVNFLGSTALTTRTAAAGVSGITLTATEATGDQTLMVDNTGRTTTALNANLFTGFDNIVMKDSASPGTGGDGASISGLASGQKITFADDLNAATLTFKSVSGSSDTATIVLDNETASVDVDITSVDIQNVEEVTIQSSGKAGTSTSTAANVNFINDFSGDATTVTITGDTALNLDLNIDSATTGSAGSRAVTVDASGSTAAVDIETETSTGTGSVSYTITGTANNDTITTANQSNASTINAGAGNDTITSGSGNDTIDLGEGTNSYFASAGTDTVTLGTGANTLTFGEADVTAVAHVSTHTVAGIWAAFDNVTVTIGSQSATYTALTSTVADSISNNDHLQIAAELANFINTTFSGTTATAASDDIVTITALTATDATPTVTTTESTAGTGAVADTVTTTGIDAVAVATTVTGFKTGTVDDVISFDVSEINAVSGVTNLRDGDANVTGGDDVVLLNYTVGTSFVDTDGIADGQNVIKVAYSNTINAFSDLSSAIDINTITVDAIFADNDAMVTVYYDADAGDLVWGLLQHDTTDAVLDDNLVFLEQGKAAMTQAQYAALGTANFSFVV